MNTGEFFDDIWAKIDSKELEEPFKLDIHKTKNIDLSGTGPLTHLR